MWAGEQCDDGNTVGDDGCSASCQAETQPYCGDGIVQYYLGEECDGEDFCTNECKLEISGCTEPKANNYNPLATIDDESCVYDIFGCTDPFALNFNRSAFINDGSCRYSISISQPFPSVISIIPVTGGEMHAIAAGIAHTCALTAEGDVQCWGDNDYGQLGNGTNTASKIRVDVEGLQGGTTIVAGGNHTCVLSGGDVWCWGQNSTGQIGDGTTTNRNMPVKVISGAIDITAGYDYTCAIMLDGKTMCWGNNDQGQLSDGGQTIHSAPTLARLISGLSEVDAGMNKNCGLTQEGLIRCVSSSTSEELGELPQTNLNVAVNRFGTSVIALNDQGVPIEYLSGEPKIVSQLSGVQDIDSGFAHICALQNTGTVQCWGANNYGQLGNNSKNRATNPVAVNNLFGAWQLAVGRNHTCAMITTNDPNDLGIRCWGLNTDGQLGDGTNENSLVPVVVK
jgi:alpha-tubulin suppressor-like RCC1 family protein